LSAFLKKERAVIFLDTVSRGIRHEAFRFCSAFCILFVMTQEQALHILKMGHNVFLTGAPGTGKTYVVNEYIKYLGEHDINVAVTASTGIAATHIGGVTIHSWSGMGIRESLSEWDIEAMLEKKYIWNRFDTTNVLIIDEVSMLSANMLDSLDRLARTMRNNHAPFGGMQIVLVGDFFQLPPISNTGVVYAFQAKVWKEADMHVCYLGKSYRQDEGPLYSLLCQIREQNIDDTTHELLAECQELRVQDIEPTRLYTHNIDVDTINEEKLAQLKTPLKIFHAQTRGSKKNVELLQKTMLAPEALRLKKGALVMFVKNNLEKGYVNGTMGYVVDVRTEIVVEKIDDTRIVVQPESWSVTNDDGKVLAEVTQLPLRLAWAITVHKSQGMTLDAAEIDLSKCFVPGQGYVALSRVRSIEGLKILGYNAQSLAIDETVLEHDTKMKDASTQIKRRLAITDEKVIEKRHHEFITRVGGSINPIVAKKVIKSPKESTYKLTKKLLEKKTNIVDIAKERDVNEQTILTHIEELLEQKEIMLADINYLRPARDTFDNDILRVQNAMKKAEDDKLSTLKRALDNKYSYEELKFIKLFCKIKK